MRNKSAPSQGNVRAVLVPLAFFALAAVLFGVPWRFDSPVAAASVVPEWAVDPVTVRQPSLTPEIMVGSFTYRCSDCHRLFPARATTGRTLLQHREIVLEHGINDRCLSCHHPDERDAFVDGNGDMIPYDQPPLLCAKCHGPVYRDWQHGVHGRSNGYWDTGRGPLTRKECTECHDPHRPPFPPMRPAPPPNTLRMGPQTMVEHLPAGNPLRIHDQPDKPGGAALPLSGVEAGEDG